NGRAHHYIALPAIARQQHLEGSQQAHVHGHAFSLAQLAQLLSETLSQPDWKVRSPVTLGRGTRKIERQVDYMGSAGELTFPVGQLFFEDLSLQPLPLPYGIISVLNLELRQR